VLTTPGFGYSIAAPPPPHLLIPHISERYATSEIMLVHTPCMHGNMYLAGQWHHTRVADMRSPPYILPQSTVSSGAQTLDLRVPRLELFPSPSLLRHFRVGLRGATATDRRTLSAMLICRFLLVAQWCRWLTGPAYDAAIPKWRILLATDLHAATLHFRRPRLRCPRKAHVRRRFRSQTVCGAGSRMLHSQGPPRLPALSLRFGITLSNERDTARAEGSVARLPRVYAR
jgi:hypothetical protein